MAPGSVVDEAAVVVAQGRRVVVVAPDVVAALLVQIGAAVAADAGVDANGRVAVQALGPV